MLDSILLATESDYSLFGARFKERLSHGTTVLLELTPSLGERIVILRIAVGVELEDSADVRVCLRVRRNDPNETTGIVLQKDLRAGDYWTWPSSRFDPSANLVGARSLVMDGGRSLVFEVESLSEDSASVHGQFSYKRYKDGGPTEGIVTGMTSEAPILGADQPMSSCGITLQFTCSACGVVEQGEIDENELSCREPQKPTFFIDASFGLPDGWSWVKAGSEGGVVPSRMDMKLMCTACVKAAGHISATPEWFAEQEEMKREQAERHKREEEERTMKELRRMAGQTSAPRSRS